MESRCWRPPRKTTSLEYDEVARDAAWQPRRGAARIKAGWPKLVSEDGTAVDVREWNSSEEPLLMLEFLGNARKGSNRKYRLYGVSCCRTMWDWLERLEQQGLGRGRHAVLVAERFADGLATRDELRRALLPVDFLTESGGTPWSNLQSALQALTDAEGLDAAVCITRSILRAQYRAALQAEQVSRGGGFLSTEATREICRTKTKAAAKEQCGFLRDSFGHMPFRSVALDPFLLKWRDRVIPRLAEAIYEERAFERMPILTDALEEAGVTDQDILGHCRQQEGHTRGCWCLDLLLGKE
jgi:hypothetical protein